MTATVSALFIHGPQSSLPKDPGPTAMIALDAVHAVEGMGLQEDRRYFRRPPDAHERKRQVSLIDEGTLLRLENRFGLIPRAFVKSQIVLAGDLFLPDMIGTVLRFTSGAELTVAVYRKPCFAMDLISPGLREAMEDGRQGALAKVRVSGVIALGDAVEVLQPATEPALV